MNFSELESLMFSHGVKTLAEIARALETTPQAVSNWKARDQVPYPIIDKLNKLVDTQSHSQPSGYSSPVKHDLSNVFEENNMGLSDLLLVIAEQLKVILRDLLYEQVAIVELSMGAGDDVKNVLTFPSKIDYSKRFKYKSYQGEAFFVSN